MSPNQTDLASALDKLAAAGLTDAEVEALATAAADPGTEPEVEGFSGTIGGPGTDLLALRRRWLRASVHMLDESYRWGYDGDPGAEATDPGAEATGPPGRG